MDNGIVINILKQLSLVLEVVPNIFCYYSWWIFFYNTFIYTSGGSKRGGGGGEGG